MSMRLRSVTGQARTKAFTAGAMLAASTAAFGAAQPSAAGWQYGVVIYGWLPSIDGDLRYAPRGSDGSFSVDASRIIDNLRF